MLMNINGDYYYNAASKNAAPYNRVGKLLKL